MMKPLLFSWTCIHAEVNCFLRAGKKNALRINCKNMKWSNHRFLTFVIWINDHGRETDWKLSCYVVQAEGHSGRWNENISRNIWQIKQFQLGLQENKEIHARLMREAFKITWNPDGFSNNPSTQNVMNLRAVGSLQRFKLLISLLFFPKDLFYLSIQKLKQLRGSQILARVYRYS